MSNVITQSIEAIAANALIEADPAYQSWPSDQQERFRASIDQNKEVRRIVEAALLRDIMGIQCSPEDASLAWRSLTISELNQVNPALELIQGIGEDYVYLNEGFEKGRTLLDFETIYDYDYDNYVFQEKHRHKDFPDYVSTGYQPLQYPRWVRFIKDGRQEYGTMYSLASYISTQVESIGDEYIDRLIPFSYVHGPNHGKKVKGGQLSDIQISANGLEQEVEQLRNDWYLYQRARERQLQREFAGSTQRSWLISGSCHDEHWIDVILLNESTLKGARWKTLLTDVKAHQGEEKEVLQVIERESILAKIYLKSQYEKITGLEV